MTSNTPAETPAETPAPVIPTGPELVDKLIAAVQADKRNKGSEGTWDRTVRHVGVPVALTYILDGTFRLGAGQPTYVNENIPLPKGSTRFDAIALTAPDGTKVITRHDLGRALASLDKDDPLAVVPGPNAEKLREYVAGVRRAQELADLKAENAHLTARVAELEAELAAATAKPAAPAKPAAAPKSGTATK
ncbi:hypothetical protein ACWEN6_13695 [Sphaerisporangium sp. NPDC004334]